MKYDQCTPLITSNYGVDARGEVAEGRVWAATCPKSCRCNFGSHINGRRLGVTGIDNGNVTSRLKIIIIVNASQYWRAQIHWIWVEELKRSDGRDGFCVVASLQDGYPKRIVKGAAEL